MDYKPRVKSFMREQERLDWIDGIKKGIECIKLSFINGLMTESSYMHWLILREAELKCNEFYFIENKSIRICFDSSDGDELIKLLSESVRR